jgi:hypothetical protein
MQGLDTRTHNQQHATGIADPSLNPSNSTPSANTSVGSSVQDSNLEKALNQTLAPDEQAIAPATTADDHDHAPVVGPFQLHVDLNNVANARGLDVNQVGKETTFLDKFGDKGDFINPGQGNNVVIGTGGNDVIRATGGGLNTITTGSGNDIIILGKETTNRILDFDPSRDHFDLQGLNPKNIIIAQGKNPGKGGLDQPLDSVNNALVIDKESNHILATLPFVKASDLSEKNFEKLTPEANQSLKDLKNQGFTTQKGDGQLTGKAAHERLIGGNGDDFIFAAGDNGVKFNTAKTTSGANEFPFPNDSQGSSEANLSLKDGVLTVNGSYKDFNAFPLFSQGEKTIAPDAKILNGSDPVSLINNFLKVPNDVEGNPLSGTHLHFSPSGDDRGNFADATVVRYFTNTPTSPTTGTISGQFHLTPVEQAALLAGDLYLNIHTNINGTGDGKSGFPTGENRINFNKDVVQFV